MIEPCEETRRFFELWQQENADVASAFAHDAGFMAQLYRVWEGSEYVRLACEREPALLGDFYADGLHSKPIDPAEVDRRLQVQLEQVGDVPALHCMLRRFRRSQMMQIIWHDLAGTTSLDGILQALSSLADSCIKHPLEWLYNALAGERGTPLSSTGKPLRMLVIGMGKLGAAELNMSSDIDLILAYAEQGQTDAQRPMSNSEFFIRLAQQLVQALDTRDGDGFVFRVDTRLRPFGSAGPIAVSLGAMEDYYLAQGREWERYAMIKARCICGDADDATRFESLRRPFVYRRYLDYGALESLRDMKRMIDAELHRRGMDANIKLGRGGIREIEFIGQAFQLIRGGREPSLQIRPIVEVLTLLRDMEQLPAADVNMMIENYRFLRLVENRLQCWRDEQTHVLPADEQGRLRLARAMGFERWDGFNAELEYRRNQTQTFFDNLFAMPDNETIDDEVVDTVFETGDAEAVARLVDEYGFADVAASQRVVQQFCESRPVRLQGDKGRKLTARLLPRLLAAASRQRDPERTLENLLNVLESVARRTAYIALLVEREDIVLQLARLVCASDWVGKLISRHPMLLDDLLDVARLFRLDDREELAKELADALSLVDEDNEEARLNQYRHFQQSQLMRVAAADIDGEIPLMKVSDYLTAIAEVVLESIVEEAYRYILDKHGQMAGLPEGSGCGLAIIGYGKLGGIELGYGSDLDLVFLHSVNEVSAMSNGARALSSDAYFIRLGQRIIQWLTTPTAAGTLYEVDMRLRPNGNSGHLAHSLQAFQRYQSNDAWVWEHQALVRARPVAGDPVVVARFEEIRREILSQRRDDDPLRHEVVQMRSRMREQLEKRQAGKFDLKQGEGGIADIEFMVQYAVLRWACDYPQLLAWTDNVRLLDTLAEHELFESGQARQLADAYRNLRAEYHRLALQDQPGLIPDDQLTEDRGAVSQIWRQLMREG